VHLGVSAAGDSTIQQTALPAVTAGQVYMLNGTGWVPGAPVTLATVNGIGTVARYDRAAADGGGVFRLDVISPEPGPWTHRAYWQPDPALPPRDVRATLQVHAHRPGEAPAR
jgi:hypothetical protein